MFLYVAYEWFRKKRDNANDCQWVKEKLKNNTQASFEETYNILKYVDQEHIFRKWEEKQTISPQSLIAYAQKIGHDNAQRILLNRTENFEELWPYIDYMRRHSDDPAYEKSLGILSHGIKKNYPPSIIQAYLTGSLAHNNFGAVRIFFNTKIFELLEGAKRALFKEAIELDRDSSFALLIDLEPNALPYLLQEGVSLDQWKRIVTDIVEEKNLYDAERNFNILTEATKLDMSAHAKHIIKETKNKTLLNTSDRDGKTALMHAIERNNEVASYLLTKDFLLNRKEALKLLSAQDNAGKTALQYAIELGHQHIASQIFTIRGFIQEIAPIHDNNKENLLHHITKSGNLELLSAILYRLVNESESGIGLLRSENNYGDTPLDISIKKDLSEFSLSFIKLLNEKDLCTIKANGFGSLSLAAFKGQFNVVEAIFNQVTDPNLLLLKDKSGNSFVHYLARAQRYDLVKKLDDKLEHSYQLFSSTSGNHNILHMATGQENIDDFLYVLKRVPNDEILYAQSVEGHTPLMIAAIAGDRRKVSEILALTTDCKQIELNDENSLTAEAHAKNNRNTQIASMIRDRISQLSPKQTASNDNEKEIAHEWDSSNGYEIVLREKNIFDKIIREFLELLESGDDVALSDYIDDNPDVINFTDESGNNAIMYAISFGQSSSFYELIARGIDPNSSNKYGMTAAMLAAAKGNIEILRSLEVLGVDFNRANKNGFIPIMASISANKDEVTEFLLPKLTNPNHTNKYGNSLLHLCAFYNQPSIMKELIDKGAYPDQISLKGRSPLHVASVAGSNECVKILISEGADVNRQDVKGVTPAYSASCNGNSEILGTLASHGADINKVALTGEKAITLICGLNQRFYGPEHTNCVEQLIAAGANPKRKGGIFFL